MRSGTNNSPNKNVTYGRRPRLEEQRGLAEPLLARGEVWHFAEVLSLSLCLCLFSSLVLSPPLPWFIFAAKPPLGGSPVISIYPKPLSPLALNVSYLGR